MQRELTLIPMISIHPGQLNMYTYPLWDPPKPREPVTSFYYDTDGTKFDHLINSKRTAEGKVSDIAKRKILKAINYFLFITNTKTIRNSYSGKYYSFKLAFITLTLCSTQLHNDNIIKNQCLNQFLIELKKYNKVNHYIWRAEKQKNGNIHFHLLVDKFIDHQELRDRWNRIINKLKYVDNYRIQQQTYHKDGFRIRPELLHTWNAKKQYEAYKRGSKINWNSPNTTDIHSIRRVFNLKQYFAKYLTKNEINELQNQDPDNDILTQKGRIWACDDKLNNLKGARSDVDGELQKEIESIIKTGDVKILTDKYYTVVYFNMKLLLRACNQRLFKLFCAYLFEQFTYTFQLESFS